MSDRIFTVDYYSAVQKKFETALQNKDLNGAYNILENILPADTLDEKIKRTVVLAQGYRALAKASIDMFIEETKLDKYKEYEELGTPEELSALKSRYDKLSKTLDSLTDV